MKHIKQPSFYEKIMGKPSFGLFGQPVKISERDWDQKHDLLMIHVFLRFTPSGGSSEAGFVR